MMPNDEPTLPPHQPRTIRTYLRRFMEWAALHPEACAIGAGLLLAFGVGFWMGR